MNYLKKFLKCTMLFCLVGFLTGCATNTDSEEFVKLLEDYNNGKSIENKKVVVEGLLMPFEAGNGLFSNQMTNVAYIIPNISEFGDFEKLTHTDLEFIGKTLPTAQRYIINLDECDCLPENKIPYYGIVEVKGKLNGSVETFIELENIIPMNATKIKVKKKLDWETSEKNANFPILGLSEEFWPTYNQYYFDKNGISAQEAYSKYLPDAYKK